MPRRLLRAALLVLLGLAGAEAVVRAALVWTPLADRLAWRVGPTSTELGWWVHARRGEPTLGWFVHDPRTGWRNAPGSTQPQGDVVHHVDEDGRRVTGPRGQGPRVALLGDSFTFGTDADDADTWAWQLQATHPDWAVHDEGVASWSLTQAWLAARETEADVVVVGVNTLLVDRTTSDFAIYRRPVAASESRGCALPAPVPDEATLLRQVGWRPKLVDAVALVRWWWSPPTREASWTRARAQLDCLAAEPGVPRLFAWLPLEVDLDLQAREPGPVRAAFLAWCAETGAACVDATLPALEVARRGEPLTHGTHWSAAVHAAVATAVGPAVEALLDATPP
ncbi:MAG: SGNH/GDSL hydrolase family protein [Alphaproteobacteria bacterium]|nr:SGNH/GDSL hydrolase family protein [Alphaproteobacteria bacterium]